jgi:hypothetical protein
MKNQKAGGIKKTARIAGLIYFLQIPLGIFGIMYVQQGIVVPGSLDETVNNILNHEFLFRLSVISAILAAIVTVFTALWLYKVLSKVNKTHAMLMVLFAAIAAPITIVNELNHLGVLVITKGSAQQILQQEPTLWLFLDLHRYGVHIATLFWGLWLLPMGYLVFKSTYIPKVIGVLLVIGGIGYVADFVTFLLLPDLKFAVSEYTFIGEVAMVIWLLTKGINEKKYEALSWH